MIQGKELPRTLRAFPIDAEDDPDEDNQPQAPDVHLSYASSRHGPSERVLSGQVLNDSLMAL